MFPISSSDITKLTSSRESCLAYLSYRHIRGWPTLVTPEPGKHFLIPPPVTFSRK